jgi:hypothetical protein
MDGVGVPVGYVLGDASSSSLTRPSLPVSQTDTANISLTMENIPVIIRQSNAGCVLCVFGPDITSHVLET